MRWRIVVVYHERDIRQNLINCMHKLLLKSLAASVRQRAQPRPQQMETKTESKKRKIEQVRDDDVPVSEGKTELLSDDGNDSGSDSETESKRKFQSHLFMEQKETGPTKKLRQNVPQM